MARNPVAQTAYGPMVLAAIEHHEPPGQRLVDDDLATPFLPTVMRWLVAATRPAPLRRWFIAAMDRSGPGLWVNLTCRKRFIADRVDEAIGEHVAKIQAVVILGAGLDTLAYRLARRSPIPVFEVDQPVNIARKATTVRRVLGELPLSVRLVALDFEHDDVLTTLVEHGYRTAFRTFFVAEGVTQYLTESAVRGTLEGLRAAATGSRLVFTYVRRDFIDGTNLYGSPTLYRKVCAAAPASPLLRRASLNRRVGSGKLWHFGLQPAEVADFLAEYGWRLIEQAGPEQFLQRYVEPTGRRLGASDLEWSVYAEKL
ncbi:SAM-dependent methyltransferase [Mycobacterium sp. SVM_VP21]|nr:SAM-dependent methyltransferase [Mycobacterium sp. SVM_VP21]